MKKKTLGQVMAGIRTEKSMTMLQVGLKCELSEAVVWKIERDRPVRWETIHAVFTVAYNIHPPEAIYQTIHYLWLKQRNEHAEARPEGSNKRKLSKHGVEATRKFREAIHDLDPVQTRKVLEAALRSARIIGK